MGRKSKFKSYSKEEYDEICLAAIKEVQREFPLIGPPQSYGNNGHILWYLFMTSDPMRERIPEVEIWLYYFDTDWSRWRCTYGYRDYYGKTPVEAFSLGLAAAQADLGVELSRVCAAATAKIVRVTDLYSIPNPPDPEFNYFATMDAMRQVRALTVELAARARDLEWSLRGRELERPILRVMREIEDHPLPFKALEVICSCGDGWIRRSMAPELGRLADACPSAVERTPSAHEKLRLTDAAKELRKRIEIKPST
jgi:hypothetical protein